MPQDALYTGEQNTPPFSLEAEQSVLGAVLADSSCLSTVMEYIRPECFYDKRHQGIFSVMLRFFGAGQPIDFVTVLDGVISEEIFSTQEDAKVYLARLVEVVPTISNVEAYARIIQEKHYLRSLIETAQGIIENARDPQNEAKSLLDSAEQRIFQIRQGREGRGLQRIDEIIIDAYDRLQKLSSADREQYLGLSTGFTMLDQITTGLNKTDLIFVAARPGMGKTAFALNVATHVAKKGKRVAIFNLEMSKDQLAGRILSGEARIPGNALRTGNLSAEDWNRLAEAAGYLSKAEIYIDDATGISPGEIKARLRRMREVDLVIIDYLQLMTTGRRIDNRVQEVSEMTRSLKVMAKELQIPVMTLSQLSRGPESRRDNHRPMLSDLRESGSIEQDADAVWFLYRDAYYNKDSDEQNIAECIVAKNRHGETDTVKLAWDGAYTRFGNLEMYRNEG
ncbi:MAG: replicative DNA helicase [Oscillospiraceae bacterium]|nr:replicative DNA helicase [Oscillospiraceae bacterium]